jgi:hypothetical protein
VGRCRSDPDAFTGLASRWLPIVRGYPEAADGFVRLARCGSPAWQATTGLTSAENLIGDNYTAVACRCYHLPGWLGEVRPAVQGDAGATARWRRLIDGLAAAGDSQASRVQQVEE